jgi:tetratricopeptide (TPR) repeat protein
VADCGEFVSQNQWRDAGAAPGGYFTLTEDWQLGKKLPDAPKVVLKESEVVELLAPLAYWMHEEKPSGVVTQAEAEERLAATLAELNDDEPESESVRQAVEQFLRKVRETTGLFVERAPGVYGFMHLTFEEYFAARYIADHERSEILELIRKHLHEPRWNEPILLALGYYGVHSPRQVNKLVEELFSNLEGYEPAIQDGEIRIKNASSPDAVIVWSDLQDESGNVDNSSELRLKDLLFAGEVLTQVEVNSRIRSRIIEKLVMTLVLDAASQGDTTEGSEKIIRLLRQIEVFNQKGEVIDQLKQLANDPGISDLGRAIAQLVILYVACGEAGSILVNCATDIINQLNPLLFRGLKGMVTECGEEMTPALESTLQVQLIDRPSQQAVTFLTALSYIRTDCYGQAIALLEQLNEQPDNNISPFIAWALATCYQAQDNYEKAIEYYGQSWDRLATYPQQNTLLYLWSEWGIFYRLHTKYEQSLDCFKKVLAITQELNRPGYEASTLYEMSKSYQAWGKYEQALECEQNELAIRQKLDDQLNIADAYYQLGRIHQDWGKYEQAIAQHEQSLDLYRQLGQQESVANQWKWLSDCYQAWGKYEQAIECQQQCLRIRQTLDDQSDVASAYYKLGRIYQAWGKYEQAIAHHQQSRDLYRQLGQQESVANQWDWLAYCYLHWDRYEQAVECQQQCLIIRQTLDDQSDVASAYYQLGRIYQDWGKYEEAITHYEQSRDLYEQLGQEKNVANRWYNIADTYHIWGKYEQAVECELMSLAIRQLLDDQPNIANAYWQLGRIYQSWGKYEQAIAYRQQSCELYEQLGEQKTVANHWYWLADCYREWGKYKEAVQCELKDLEIRQQLEDQPNIADAYSQLGRIYQAWGKYEQAIANHQQSLELYEQLGQEKNIAIQWYWLATCYRKWSKYEQAVECELKLLAGCQKLDDQKNIAKTYYQLGRIYQDWGKYEQAIEHYQQSRNFYEQPRQQKDVANLWFWLAACYGAWGKYEQAVECELKDLAIHQQLDDQPNIANAYCNLGWIHQAWGKYEQAIAHYRQSRELYEQLGQEQDVAKLWSLLAACYGDWGKYEQAIEYCQQSLTLCQKLGLEQGSAWNFRAIANTQRLLAKNTPDIAEASNLLTQAEQNIRQAIQLDTAGDYKENLAYDYTSLGFLWSEHLRLLPPDDSSLPEQIAQFEDYYNTGLTYLTELGETVDRADETLDMARAYLEVSALENLNQAEALAQESLQIFQDYNRRKLEAAARKLVGEIYLKRAQRNQPNAEAIAHQFLSESLQLYRELDLTEKAAEVEQLMPPNSDNAEQK